MLRAIDISTSGLVAQRQRMNTVAENIANAQTTRNEKGEPSPYQRRVIHFSARPLGESPGKRSAGTGLDPVRGVGVSYEIEVDRDTPPRQLHEPSHPDADENGNVSYPAIDMVTEFVNALEASRAYEANVTAMDITKRMSELSLRIIA